MKKLAISVILTLFMGCVTIPNIVMKSSGFTIKAEHGFVECLLENGKVMTFPFIGDVYFEGEWIVFTPKTTKPLKRIVIRDLCKVYITDGDIYGRQKNNETQKHKKLGNGIQHL